MLSATSDVSSESMEPRAASVKPYSSMNMTNSKLPKTPQKPSWSSGRPVGMGPRELMRRIESGSSRKNAPTDTAIRAIREDGTTLVMRGNRYMMAIVASATPTEARFTISGMVCRLRIVPMGPPAGAPTPRNGKIWVITMITPIPLMNPDTTG